MKRSDGSAAVIAATKLRPPAARAGLVARPRLVERLVAARARLTLVDAPPGSGKTSLLGAWYEAPAETRPFAWLSVDEADNDPARFWTCLLDALESALPGTTAPARAALGAPGTEPVDLALPLLVNALAERGEAAVVVLDDYHLLQHPQVHEGVGFLVERLPAAIHLVIATRSDPPLPLSRLRARGELLEVRAQDLRFTADEAEELLNGTLGLGLARDDLDSLQERTEGWAAGLQLAGLSLRGREDPHAFVAEFAGDDRHVVDYLGFEVLERLPPDMRRFLLRSSILQRLKASLCEAVTGESEAGELLAQLEAANLFVVALDSRREWYRYHQLFRDLLVHELSLDEPDLVPELHRRASEWYREQGSPSEAIAHATAAGDGEAAAALITAHWYEFLQQGRLATVAGWIRALPPEVVLADPALCLTSSWIAVNGGRLDEVERWIHAAERATYTRRGVSYESGVASVRAIHRYMSGAVGEAVEAGRHALDLERGGQPSPWRPVGCPVLGLALFWEGHDTEALAALREAVDLAEAGGNHLATIHASGGLAVIHAHRGELDTAADLAADALELSSRYNLGEHWATTLSRIELARARARQGDLERAVEELSGAVERSRRGIASVEIARALAAQAEILAAAGRREEARVAAAQAATATERCPDPGILREMVGAVVEEVDGQPPRPVAVADADLSEREYAVLRLLKTGLSQREIAGELYVSMNTVKTHTRNIYRKLSAATRDEAVARARQLELL